MSLHPIPSKGAWNKRNVPADPLLLETERFFGRKEVLYLTPLPLASTPSRRPPWSIIRGGLMDWYLFYLRYHINGAIHCLIEKIFFFLSFHAAIFKPTISLEPVFQPVELALWIRNRGDAIRHSEECKQIDVRFLWNKIQLHFPF